MIGQWIGEYSGYNVKGNIVVNIERRNSIYIMITYLLPYDQNIPSSVAYGVIDENLLQNEIEVKINAIDPRNGEETTWDKIKNLYSENIFFISNATVKVKFENTTLIISAKSKVTNTANENSSIKSIKCLGMNSKTP